MALGGTRSAAITSGRSNGELFTNRSLYREVRRLLEPFRRCDEWVEPTIPMNPPGTFRRFDDLILLETTPDQLLDAIASKIRSRETCTLLYLNPHIYSLACRDARLRAAL